MAIGIDLDALGEGGGGWTKETEVIPEGSNVCRLVSYVEMGHHTPVFGGKRAVYDSGKNAGKNKPDEMLIHLTFEFPSAHYTGDFPLTIRTSAPYGNNGDVMNKLHIPLSLEEGWASKSIAMKMKFVKALLAMQAATKTKHPSMDLFVGEAFCCTIKHSLGKKADDSGNIPVYANMSLESLTAPRFKHPMTGKTEELEVPDTIGEYCEKFIWSDPTIEAWGALPKYIKDFIMRATDYPGSELEMLLADYSEPEAEGTPDYGPAEEAPKKKTGSAPEVYEDDIPF